MQPLIARLLGRFTLEYQGAPLDLAARPRMQSLLAYLLLHRDEPPARLQIVTALWPDVSEAQGRNRLRNLLHQLRQQWPAVAQFIQIDGATIAWRHTTPYELDVATLEQALAMAEQQLGQQKHEQLLLATVEQYAGDLFPSCYDEWIAPLRAALRDRIMQSWAALIALSEARNAWHTARRYAERLRQLDPARESTYCHLMQIHAQLGDQVALQQTYEQCRHLLEREVAALPTAATEALYAQLLGDLVKRAGDPLVPNVKAGEANARELPLVGRVAEWRKLQLIWQHVQQGKSQLVVIQGEAGIGKSRLAQELLWWGAHQQIYAASATCYAAEGALVYAPIAEWLRAEPFWHSLGSLEDLWLAEVARLLPELRNRYPHLPPASSLAESWQRQHFFTALTIALLEHGEPVLLLLDNLHWSDPETLEWLHYLLRYETPTPLLVVATLRTDDALERERCQPLLRELHRQDLLVEITLLPLSVTETTTLAEQLLGQELFAVQSAQLFHETEGNPFFVIETVRSLPHLWEPRQGKPQHGELTATPSGPATVNTTTGVGPTVQNDIRHLPPKVRTLIESRLARLSALATELMQLAAVIGRRFSYSLLVAASERNEEAVLAGVEELWQQQIVREAATDLFDFSHDKVREVAYATLSPMRRRFLHRKIGDVLSQLHQDDLLAVNGQIAAHFEAAGHFAQAVLFYRAAANHSAQLYAFSRAEAAYANAIRLGRQINLASATLSELYQERGRMLELHGDYVDAIATYRELEALAKVHHDPALELTAVARMATCYIEPSTVHDQAAAIALLERGIALARTIGDHRIEVQLLRMRMVDASHYGSDEEARTVGEAAIAAARTHELTDELASLLNDSAVHLRLSGRQVVAQRHADEARELFQQQQNLPMLADNLAQQAWHFLHQRDFAAALRVANECIDLSGRINNEWNLCLAWQIRAQIAEQLGDWGAALAHFDKAIVHGQQAGFVIGAVATPTLLGDLLRTIGNVAEAQELHLAAHDVAAQKAPFLLHAVQAQLALNAYNGGAITDGDRWLALARANRPRGAIGRGWCVLADIALATVGRAQVTDQWDEAHSAVEEALTEAAYRALPIYLPRLLIAQGRTLIALGAKEHAVRVLHQAQELVTTPAQYPILWQAHKLLALLNPEAGAAAGRADLFDRQQQQQLAVQEANYLASTLDDPRLRASFLAQIDSE